VTPQRRRRSDENNNSRTYFLKPDDRHHHLGDLSSFPGAQKTEKHGNESEATDRKPEPGGGLT